MRVLVTGVPGWLGNRLVEVLCRGWGDSQEQGLPEPPQATVRCLILPGEDPSLFKSWGCEVALGDVTEKSSLNEALRGVDLVFHLVGLIHPKQISDLYRVNTQGTRNMLEAAAQAGASKFIYVSSNSPGGHNTGWGRPMTESDPVRPYMAYGRSKWLAEKAVQGFQQSGRLKTVILRPCWFYGPGQPLRQTRFFTMIKSGRPIFFGDGGNARSMSYVDNTVQALLLAERTPQAVGQTYWVADERPYPMEEVYQTVAELLGVKLAPWRIPAITSTVCERVDGLLQTVGLYSAQIHVAGEMAKEISCSVEKAKRELDYRPAVELKEGMRRSIEWCRAQGVPI